MVKISNISQLLLVPGLMNVMSFCVQVYLGMSHYVCPPVSRCPQVCVCVQVYSDYPSWHLPAPATNELVASMSICVYASVPRCVYIFGRFDTHFIF